MTNRICLAIWQRFRQQIKKRSTTFTLHPMDTVRWSFAQDSDVDLVLSDINMPGMDGSLFGARLRCQSARQSRHGVGITGDFRNIREA